MFIAQLYAIINDFHKPHDKRSVMAMASDSCMGNPIFSKTPVA